MSERIHDKSGKSRRRTSSFLLVLVILILASGLWGCDLFKMFFGSPEEKEHVREQILTAISSMITDVAQKMNTRGIIGLNSASVAAISSNVSKMANEAVALSKYSPDDLEHLIPIAAGAAVGSLGSIVLDDDKRTASVDAIVGAFVSCMNGRFEATKNLRALSASAQIVSDIIASISMAAVTNLSKAGYASGNNTGLTAAASSIVGTMIGSLGDGGVNKIIVNTVVGGITQSAVESLKAAGLSNADALAVAVQSVTKGAVSAVTTLTVGGVSSTDYPSLAAEISKSAAAALGSITVDATAAIPLVDAVATGAAEGVKAVKASTPTLDVLSMIQETTAGTTVGVMSNSFATAGNSTALIQTVTSNMSQELLTGGTIQQTDVLSQVTQGAAAAAQDIPTAPHDPTALTTAITLTLADGKPATSSTFENDINAGISLGQNHPPVANAGSDQSVFVGATVTLDGTKSSDADSADVLILSYAWTLINKPSTSTASIAGATSSTATFVPDALGTYIVSLKVSDGKEVTEAFCTIKVVPLGTVLVTGVNVSPTTTSIVQGSTQQLTATISPANATNKNVTWSSSNHAVATVSQSGLMTTIAAGSTTIMVTTADGSYTATCVVTVSPITVGMVLPSAQGSGDSYIDEFYVGMQRAVTDFGITSITRVSNSANYTTDFAQLAQDGASLIISSSWSEQAVSTVANSYPGTIFVVFDKSSDLDPPQSNVVGVVFREQESGYLAGIVAGYLTKKDYTAYPSQLNAMNVVGTVLGMDGIPAVERFRAGFYAGVKSVNPECEILSVTTGSFSNPTKGETDALGLIAQGADIIFAIAGGTGNGVYKAASDSGILAIGVDIDQNALYPNTIVTSAIKTVDQAAYLVVNRFLDHTLRGGKTISLGMTEGATGLIAPFHSFDPSMPQEVKNAVAAASTRISNSSLLIPASETQMVHIGVAGSLSSSALAQYGLPMVRAMRFLTDETNKAGGLLGKFVALEIRDDDSLTALTAATKLTDAGVVGVIGHTTSAATESALPTYAAHNLPLLSSTATKPSLTLSDTYPNFFRTTPHDGKEAQFLVDFALGQGKRNFAVISDVNDSYGNQILYGLTTAYLSGKGGGVSIVLSQAFDFTGPNLPTLIAALSGADSVIFCGPAGTGASLVNALRNASITVPFLSFGWAKSQAFITGIGSNTQAVYLSGMIDPSTVPAVEARLQAYRDGYGEEPGPFFINAYMAGEALFSAIGFAGSLDGPSIINQLKVKSFMTPLGSISFDSHGDIVGGGSDFLIYRVENGNFVTP